MDGRFGSTHLRQIRLTEPGYSVVPGFRAIDGISWNRFHLKYSFDLFRFIVYNISIL